MKSAQCSGPASLSEWPKYCCTASDAPDSQGATKMKPFVATILCLAAFSASSGHLLAAETNALARREPVTGKILADDLVAAAREGNVSRVQDLLKRGAAPDLTNAFGWPAIVVAAENGRTPVVAALLEHGANVNARGRREWTAIMQAAKNGHLDTVQLLVARGASIHAGNYSGEKCADLAAANRHAQVLAFLESKGAARATPRILTMAAYEGRMGILNDLFDDDECAKYLKPYVSDAFFTAARFGQFTAAEFLLSRGAQVNYRDKYPRVPEEYGRTVLLAVLEDRMSHGSLKSPEAVSFLIKAGADVTVKNTAGESALQLARKIADAKVREHIVAQLTEAGAKQ
jgi:ankyrin repeat protein